MHWVQLLAVGFGALALVAGAVGVVDLVLYIRRRNRTWAELERRWAEQEHGRQ